MSNYYITVGANSYSFDQIFTLGTGTGQVSNFFDNNTDVRAKYKNIITNEDSSLNTTMIHTNLNYYVNNISISKYLLPKYIDIIPDSSSIEQVVYIDPRYNYIRGILIGSGGGGARGKSGENETYGGGGYDYFVIPCNSMVRTCTAIVTTGGGAGSRNAINGANGGDGGDTTITYNNISYRAYGGKGGLLGGGGGKGGGREINKINTYPGANGAIGGNSGFYGITYQGIDQTYGKGGNQETGDEFATNGSKGFMRIYFCIN
jgi:hypothetical protein